MEVSVSNQVYVFFIMVATGLGCGFLFDLLRVWRRLLRPGRVQTDAGDLIFWLLISAGVFFIIFTVNNGELRWFELLGLLFGCVIYFLAFSRLCMTAVSALAKFLAKILLFILRIVLTPIAFLYRMIKRPVLWLGRLAGRLLKRGGRLCKGACRRTGMGIKRFLLVKRKS